MKIKVSDLWAEVQKVAQENPDFTYPWDDPDYEGCEYQRGGGPSCIVGHGLNRLGVPVADMAELDDEGGVPVDRLPVDFPELLEVDSDEALDRLVVVQSAQDVGLPWGEAVRRAKERSR